jgi:hypothetical protein
MLISGILCALLAVGTLMWLLFGYAGALIFPPESQVWSSISYLGTVTMAIFFFVAIVNYQSDKVHELKKVQLLELVLGYLFATRLFKSITAKLLLKASQEKGLSLP